MVSPVHVKYCHDLLLLLLLLSLLLFNALVGATADVEAASIFILVPFSLLSFLVVVVFVHVSEIAWTKFSPRATSPSCGCFDGPR
jgi:hypothetical protein